MGWEDNMKPGATLSLSSSSKGPGASWQRHRSTTKAGHPRHAVSRLVGKTSLLRRGWNPNPEASCQVRARPTATRLLPRAEGAKETCRIDAAAASWKSPWIECCIGKL